MYLLKLALRPWRLAPLSQLFSAAAVGFLLLLCGMLLWMQQGMKPVLARLTGEQVITAYLDPTLDVQDESRVVDSIRMALGAHPESAEVKLVHPEQFIQNLKGQYPELSRELEDLGTEASTVIPRYVSVAGLLSEGASDQMKAVRGVESVDNSRDRYRSVIGAFRSLRWISTILVIGIGFALLTGLMHLGRMNASLHRDAIDLLKLWGAKSHVLAIPGIISGAMVGLTGGLLAAALWMIFGRGLAFQIRALSPALAYLPIPSAMTSATLLLAGVVMGIAAGAAGRVRL